MSSRLHNEGILIDKKKRLGFSFNGKRFFGLDGDTLASALLANDQMLIGRSFKFHRPRGIVASGPEEPNALVGLNEGARHEPNQRITTTRLYEGLKATSQNHLGSLMFDFGAITGFFSRFIPAGFYYKTFIWPRMAWKHFFEPLIRKSAGLGRAPKIKDADHYEYFYVHVDVLVIGAGISGLVAAKKTVEAGAKTLLLEQNHYIGGRVLVDQDTLENQNTSNWLNTQLDYLGSFKNFKIRLKTVVMGVHDHRYVIAQESVNDTSPGDGRPRHRLWRIRARKVIVATGAIERPLAFAGNDIPGVMLASAIRDYVKLFGVSPGDRTVLLTNNDDAYRTAIILKACGLTILAIIDTRSGSDGDLAKLVEELGIRVEYGKAIASVVGRKKVSAVNLCSVVGAGAVLETLECDVVGMSGGWSPVVNLWSHCGGKVLWDDESAMFIPDRENAPIDEMGIDFLFTAGAASGKILNKECELDAEEKGCECVESMKLSLKSKLIAQLSVPTYEAPLMPAWNVPQGASESLKNKSFLDFQNDVKVSDVRLASQEGYQSVEHLKRYTTLGMATDQGKLSNVNGLAILANHLGKDIQNVGVTTFRPPYVPMTLGDIAGEARGELFKPIRKTPIDAWNNDNGAKWEPVADWRRCYSYIKDNESLNAAIQREVMNTRKNVGILDSSTLGKILIKGPDSGKFLDMIYTNLISSLPIGRCRYGLMCNENGFLFDDGVVVRLSDDSFLCHTTSGGADKVYAWLEEWLQTEWFKLKVFIQNITEQYSQIGIAGPNSRLLLQKLGGLDVSSSVVKFMDFTEGELAGIPARVFRISFTGELSFEVAVPARFGSEFWLKCIELGKDLGIQPYGTEALHIMRAEKGFIMIGDETDGTVTPQDLDLGWAVSKKKLDFIGKRAQEREFLNGDHRKTLVGLLTEGSQHVIPDGAHAVEGERKNGLPRTIGHVTSSYYSPTLGYPIAMALIENGKAKMGKLLDFPLDGGMVIHAKVVKPNFFDPEGEKQNG